MYKKSRLVPVQASDGRYTFGTREAEVVSARGRGSGGRGFISGAGETELELQRRRISERRKRLLVEIEEVRKTRAVQRAGRRKQGVLDAPGLTKEIIAMRRICLRSSYFCNNCRSLEIPSQPYARLTFVANFSNKSTPPSEFPVHQNPTPQFNPDLVRQRNGVGLVHLDSDPKNSITYDHKVDEFGADVEKIYRILRKFHSRVPKLELALQESGVVMRPGLVERVLNRCGDAGNLAYQFFVWASKQPGYKHSYDVYKAMVRTLAKMRKFGSVWAIIEEMRRESPRLITPEVFVVLMRRFASARMVKKAVDVLDEMPKYGCEPDDYVFGCLLDALAKNGSVKEAASLFEDMRMRFTPSLKHFTSLLYGWCREGKLLEAKHVLVQMREAGFEPDIVVYNNLLNGYAVAGKMADAYELLKEMRRKCCEPNAASYTVLIQALCSMEKTEEAMRVFYDMEKSGCDADIITYNALISGLCKCRKIDRAYELLDSMIQLGHAADQTTYLHIILAHEKKEQFEECMELVDEMKKIGCFPDTKIYNTLIRLACKLGEVKEGIELWNEMEASRLSPGVDSFTVLIHGLVEQGCLVEACDYFKEMVDRGLLSAPQYGTLKDLLNTLLRAEKLELAKDVWECIIMKGCELNVYAWTIWIHALFVKGHVKEACSYCLEMLDADVMPEPGTFAKLMKGLKKLYNRQIAAEITEKVRKMAADRQITFKMYKRRGERDLKEKHKEKTDGRKRRARRRRWGQGRSKADIVI